MLKPIERFLESPAGYRLSQFLLISGGNRKIRQFISDAIPHDPESSILDIGCGSQDYSHLLGGRYTGIDINPKYIDYCSENFSGEYRVMDATRLDFPDDQFDAAFNVGLCHHLTRGEIERAFEEWLRVLRPGGTLVIVDAILPLKLWNAPGWVLRKLDRGGHVLPWPAWRDLFDELSGEEAELSTFSAFPYDFSAMVWRTKSVAA